jgi:hypothetical protein
MRDKDRICTVLELLNLFDNSKKIASKILNNFFRTKKFIGSKDRKFISNSFWNILRHRFKIKWHIDRLGLTHSNAVEIILELFFLNDNYQNNILKIKKTLSLLSQDHECFERLNLEL